MQIGCLFSKAAFSPFFEAWVKCEVWVIKVKEFMAVNLSGDLKRIGMENRTKSGGKFAEQIRCYIKSLPICLRSFSRKSFCQIWRHLRKAPFHLINLNGNRRRNVMEAEKKNPLNSPSMHIELKGKKSPFVVSPHILSIQLTSKSIFKLLFCHKTNLSAPDININSSSISRTTIKVNRLQLHCFPLSRQKKNGNSCLLERCSLHTLLN